jgi:PTS system galactitol-specific IIC component
MSVVNYIVDLGPSLMMPLIILAMSLFFRIPFGRAIRAALTIGIGFIAINLVIGLLVSTLSPATEAMVNNLGINLDIVDVGWPSAATISFATTSVVPWVFVLGIALNVALIALGFTKTLDIDLWNYWHFIFGAAFVYVITGSLIVSLLVALLTMAVVLKLADATAPVVQDYFELPGVSLPHTETVAWAPVGWVIDRGLDKVPGLNKLHADPETIRQRYGIVGEPLVVGVVLGGIIGILGFGPGLFGDDLGGSLKSILNTAIGMGAVMLVLPRMVRILMEGLNPVSRGARTWLNRRFPGRDLYIGLDAALAVGQPAVIATALLLVPVVLGLAILLSFIGMNRMLPFTDLATLPFFSIWAVAWSRGNIARGVITGATFMFAFLVIGTFLAPATTEIAQNADFAIPESALLVSSLDGGGHLIPWLFALPFLGSIIAGLSVPMLIASTIVVIGTLACYVAFFMRYGLRQPDETVKADWEGSAETEEPAEEEPSEEETAERPDDEREPARASSDGASANRASTEETSSGQAGTTREPEAGR